MTCVADCHVNLSHPPTAQARYLVGAVRAVNRPVRYCHCKLAAREIAWLQVGGPCPAHLACRIHGYGNRGAGFIQPTDRTEAQIDLPLARRYATAEKLPPGLPTFGRRSGRRAIDVAIHANPIAVRPGATVGERQRDGRAVRGPVSSSPLIELKPRLICHWLGDTPPLRSCRSI